jgi:hypothetical protein
MNASEKFIMAVIVCLVIWALSSYVQDRSACSAKGGVLVSAGGFRGACVKEIK